MMDDQKQDSLAKSTTSSAADAEKKRQIKIGSQRQPESAPAIASPDKALTESTSSTDTSSADTPSTDPPSASVLSAGVEPSRPDLDREAGANAGAPQAGSDSGSPEPLTSTPSSSPSRPPRDALEPPSSASDAGRAADSAAAEELFPVSLAKRLSDDLQAEIDAALGDLSLDDLMAAETRADSGSLDSIELDQKYSARVIKCDRESVFVSIGGNFEGLVSLRQFPTPPEPGTLIEVIPTRFLTDDSLYEVVVPGMAVDVQDWSDLSEGVVVDARISGHNKGGLECEVNRIRGFIPISQVSLVRIEDLEPYVGTTLQCVVTECNPQRQNLVLSHRAVLEREQQDAKEKLMQELEVGQVREGVVRRLQDFGAFVDLGGVDGLVHISQLSWDRIRHPSEVLEEGQRVKVRIEKIDPATGRIGLSYRDLLEDPWADAEARFAVGTIVEATVSKIMDFGAFVKLAPGVEGLVHISEIAHHRVHKIAAFLKEGQQVLVKVLSFDRDSQRIGLSIKAAQASPAAAKVEEEETESDVTPSVVPQPNRPLKGGLNRGTGGDQFGLKW